MRWDTTKLNPKRGLKALNSETTTNASATHYVCLGTKHLKDIRSVSSLPNLLSLYFTRGAFETQSGM